MSTGDLAIVQEFEQYSESLRRDGDVVDKLKAKAEQLGKAGRSCLLSLQSVHKDCSESAVAAACGSARCQLADCNRLLAELRQLLPDGEYYKFHALFRDSVQQLCFAVAYLHFLDNGRLASLQEAAAQLQLAASREDGFHLDLEDYLLGLLCLATELARLSVNAVTAGCLQMPARVSAYVNELEAGFRLLNFKNDALRRRYDGLKYDMRKIEEVLYDIKVRKLT